MKYAGWNKVGDNIWKYEDADITVSLNSVYDSYSVEATGDDVGPVISGGYVEEYKDSTGAQFDKLKTAKVFAKGLRDAIHAVWSMQNRENLAEDGPTNYKRYFKEHMSVNVNTKYASISKGYYTGVQIIGPEMANGLAYEEYIRQGIKYYMTAHSIEAETSFRWSVVDYENDFNDKSIVDSSRRKSGAAPIEELDLE